MKIQVVSDIHLEFLDSDEFHLILESSAPILVMAGDIGTHTCKLLPAFLTFVSTSYETVFWVLGNHEYYSDNAEESMDDILAKLRGMCPHNVKILDNECYELNDIVFIGSTLWSHIHAEHALKIQRKVSDFRYIYKSNHPYNQLLSTDDVNRMHNMCLGYILDTVKKVTEHDENKRLVIITHHAPVLNGVSDPQYETNSIQSAFASDVAMQLENLDANANIALWICGHTHHNFKIKHKHYHIISNQFGYEGEHSGLGYRYDYVAYCK